MPSCSFIGQKLELSKHTDAVRKLAQDGWTVSESGEVVRPDGTIRETKVMVGKDGRTDYLGFNVKHDGVSRPVRVHKLCAFIKYGELAFTNVVRHLDGNSLNNAPDNIGFGTQTDNAMDRPQHERLEHALKAAKVLRVFSDNEVCDILASPKSGNALAKELEVSKGTISGIRNRHFYKDVKC